MIKDFEDFLMEKHAEQYIGTKDCMIDDFDDWVQDLGADEFIEYGDKFIARIKAELLRKIENLPKFIKEDDKDTYYRVSQVQQIIDEMFK